MKLLLCLILTVSSASALETDNYLSWGRELPDSADDLNRYIQTQIEEVLTAVPAKRKLTCEQVTFRIASRFKTSIKGEVFVNWSTKHIPDKIYPSYDRHLHESIYRETPNLLLKHAPLAPNIQAGGIYFGVDKLSHFASTGRRYFKEYLKALKKSATTEEAEKAAIQSGLSDESGILGIWASGVYSYGDLEANFQGLLFYRKFCLDEQDTYLKEDNGRWQLVEAPDIRDYANPFWDETFNLSYREPRSWAVVAKVLQEKYCSQKENKELLTRFAYYREVSVKSGSMTYIEELQASGDKRTPLPEKEQSFAELCRQATPGTDSISE